MNKFIFTLRLVKSVFFPEACKGSQSAGTEFDQEGITLPSKFPQPKMFNC